MLRLICFACLVLGYFFGTFQTAFVIGKLSNRDIRKEGSGNLGTTNMLRVMGAKAGLLTFLGDLLKVWLAILITWLVVIVGLGLPIDRIALALYTGFGTIIGHNFPFYLKFKGGKGVASTAAVYIALLDWRLFVIGVIVFFGVLLITRYVSLSSMILITVLFALIIIFNETGLMSISPAWKWDCYIVSFLMMALCIFQHRGNIRRLAKGQENRFSIKKKGKKEEK